MDILIPAEASPETIHSIQQEYLLKAANKIFAKAFEMSLSFFGANEATLPEILDIPTFAISMDLPPLNIKVNLDQSNLLPDFRDWPEFHRGIMWAMTFANSRKSITKEWMLQNRHSTSDAWHGGFLCGLGALGLLDHFERWMLLDYFSLAQPMTLIGILLGLGLTYRGTSNQWLTTVLAVHVTSMRTSDPNSIQISSLLSSSGIIGLGLNYLGTGNTKYADLILYDLQNICANGYTESSNLEAHSICCGLALGMVLLGKGTELVESGSIGRLMETLLRLVTIRENQVSHSSVADTLSIGAILALTLIFLKSGDDSIAQKLRIPETVHSLDSLRHDILLLKITGRNLILWDTIEASHEWIGKQIPNCIREFATVDQSALGRGDLKFSEMDSDLCIESIKQAYFSVLAGSCLSLGIRFAGTRCREAFSVIMDKINFLKGDIETEDISFNKKSSKNVARLCHDVMACAAAAVMAGTGDRTLFTYLQDLLKTVYLDASYCNFVACHLASGILFLGGGIHTFKSTNEAVVGLLCSLYPRFPVSPADNRSHLQALRYLWVLAVDSRCLMTRDVTTGRLNQIPVRITYKEKKKTRTVARSSKSEKQDVSQFGTTPMILPELSKIESIFLEVSLNSKLDVGPATGLAYGPTNILAVRTGTDKRSRDMQFPRSTASTRKEFYRSNKINRAFVTAVYYRRQEETEEKVNEHKRCKEKIYAERAGRIAAERAIREQAVEILCRPTVGFPALTIGYVRSPYVGKRGTPRQGQLVMESSGFIDLEKEIPTDSLEGLSAYSHIWVSFLFHQNTNLPKVLMRAAHAGEEKPSGGKTESTVLDDRNKSQRISGFNKTVPKFAAKVYAPLLNGGSVGVFATRSPHHPNPFGLSLVKIELVDIEAKRIWISGFDMCDGTPIFDLKPWNPADCPTCLHRMIDHNETPDQFKRCSDSADPRCRDFFNVKVPEWVSAGMTHAYQLPVTFEPVALESLHHFIQSDKLRFYKSGDEKKLEMAITKILALDIRSFHQGRGRKMIQDEDLVNDRAQAYELDYDDLNVKFLVAESAKDEKLCVVVTKIDLVELY
ncbi:Anaphase-promoting complex subunit 1 [Phlyctochytrium planicorne]|nr:Anaphase-promoting complex subunit 1 [Phlyctochytrium planicorne]